MNFEKQASEAFEIVNRIGPGLQFAGDTSRTVYPRWLNQMGNDPAASKAIADAATHDIKNARIVLQDVLALRGLLVSKGKASPFSIALMNHSDASGRSVGSFKLIPASSSLAGFTHSLWNWLSLVACDIMGGIDDEPVPPLRGSDSGSDCEDPNFWAELEHCCSVDTSPGNRVRYAAIIARAMSHKVIGGFTEDALKELTTFPDFAGNHTVTAEADDYEAGKLAHEMRKNPGNSWDDVIAAVERSGYGTFVKGRLFRLAEEYGTEIDEPLNKEHKPGRKSKS